MARMTADECNANGKRYRVFVDDIEHKDVIATDVDEGYIERIARDDKGEFIINGDELVFEKIYGVVRLEEI